MSRSGTHDEGTSVDLANGTAHPSMSFSQLEPPVLKLEESLSHDIPLFDSDVEDESVRCGFGVWKPEFLQRFNNPKYLTFFLAMYAGFLGFVVNGVNNVNTTAVERHFNLPSEKVGYISSAYDASAAVLGLIISYLGAKRHKARVLAISAIVSSSGSIVMTLPHYLAGLYKLGNDNTTDICSIESGASSNMSKDVTPCQGNEESSLSSYLYMFIAGQMLHGVGGTTIYTVGVALIDDSVPPASTPLYLGGLYGFAVVGPGLGYVIGGQFLSYYVDFDTVSTKMTPDDPRWVGAWWLGFLIASVVLLLLSVPFFLFGSELPSAKKIRETRESYAHIGRLSKLLQDGMSPPDEHHEYPRSFSHFCKTTALLLCNPCFVCISFSMVMEGITLSGVATFMPKMMENKFRVSASRAAMLSGLAVVPSAASGQFLGGFIANHLKLGVPGLIKQCIIVMILSLSMSAIVWLDCGQEVYVGVLSPYPSSKDKSTISMTSECNRQCQCTTDVFTPVCDENNTLYFSPCYAGCTKKINEEGFSSCSCLGSVQVPVFNQTVRSGCRESCGMIYPFLALLFVLIGITMTAVPPGDSIQLRCVPDEHKTYAQGLKLLIVRSLGTVTGPVLTGRLLDNTCTVWRKDCTGANLSCWLYDVFQMSLTAHGGVIFTKVMSITFCVLAFCLYHPPVRKHADKFMVSKNEVTHVDELKVSQNEGIHADELQVSKIEGIHTDELKVSQNEGIHADELQVSKIEGIHADELRVSKIEGIHAGDLRVSKNEGVQ